MKVTSKHFTIALGCLAGILIVFSVLRGIFGPFLPKEIDDNVPNAVIAGAMGIFLWNRKIRSEEAKAAKLAAEEALAAQEAKPVEEDEGQKGEGGH